MKQWYLYLGSVLGAITLMAADDPMQKVDAYTLELDGGLNPGKYYLPLGILGEPAFSFLPYMGMNLTERGHTCYEFREGKPCTMTASPSRRGKLFFNIWAAHTLYQSRETKDYGLLKNSVNDQGVPYKNHQLNYFDPATRKYVLDVAAANAKRAAGLDGDLIALWGIDNEWETPLDYSPEALTAFRQWLPSLYDNDIAKLNQAWGTGYPSFAEAAPPKISELNDHPGAWLDWRDFQGREYAKFLAEYFAAIQNNDPKKRPVVSKSTQCTIEMQRVARNRAINHEVLAAATRNLSQGWYAIDQYGHGDRSNYELSYLYNCVRPDDPADPAWTGLFLSEANNHAGPGWQFAQTFWRSLANGQKGVDFFVVGNFRSVEDYATFGLTNPDGTRRDRFYYASRWASMIHRNEKFWYQARPAENVPRVAILMPQRDVALAGDTSQSWWDFSINNRLNVYRRLRDMGYWVEVIPYGKLNDAFLRRYQALFLVNTEHLSAQESDNIKNFVKNGGVLLADMRAGLFDEHHREARSLEEVLGVKMRGVYSGIEVSPDDMWYNSPYGNVIRADGRIVGELAGAELVNLQDTVDNAKGAWLTRHRFGKGSAFWFKTRLGALRPESVPDLVVARFMASILADAGVKPAYRANRLDLDLVRIEEPMVDPAGNLALIVAGITNQAVPPSQYTVTVPDATKLENAFWAPAESTLLQKVALTRSGNTITFALPEISSAGVLYGFVESTPVITVGVNDFARSALHDPDTASLRPGDSFTAMVQLVTLGGKVCDGGTVNLKTLGDWQVEPRMFTVAELEPGKIYEYPVKVTLPVESAFYKPNYLFPLVAELMRDGKKVAIGNTVITVELDPAKYEWLLSNNRTVQSSLREFALLTGATYCVGDSVADSGEALISGQHSFAKFAAVAGEAVFDLKDRYVITQIVLRSSPWSNRPVGVRVLVSDDDKTYQMLTELTNLAWDQDQWCRTAVKPAVARYVKLEFTFAKADGMMDEVEIYGRPLAEK